MAKSYPAALRGSGKKKIIAAVSIPEELKTRAFVRARQNDQTFSSYVCSLIRADMMKAANHA